MTLNPGQPVDYGDGVVAVDTGFMRPQFDASHLIIESDRAAVVDTGANSGVPPLLDALARHDIDAGSVDYLFLTHVHLDHAGGAGRMLQHLPNARCVIHPRGARHIVDPTKLIAGATAVYGEEHMRRMYGDILPVDEERVVVAEDEQWFALSGRRLQTIFTEGHAKHHYCLHDPASRSVFTGDSFGVSYRELDTSAGAFIFPSATPVDFDPAEAHKSVDRILDCGPEQLYLTHFSRVTDVERLARDMHECIDGFVVIADQCAGLDNRISALEAAMFDYLAARLAEHGFADGHATMWDILKVDVFLNARGLNVWLERRASIL